MPYKLFASSNMQLGKRPPETLREAIVGGPWQCSVATSVCKESNGSSLTSGKHRHWGNDKGTGFCAACLS